MEKPVQAEERGNELFFQLSSTDRRRILKELLQEDLKLHEVAQRLEMTATETLRQLQRLTEAGLLEKMPDGKYRLTSYAKLVLDTSSSMYFISRFREYFLGHNAFLLPCEFRSRLGELSGCELIPTTVETINKVTELIQGAQKRLDTVILGTEALIEMMRQRSVEGVKIRWLMQESFIPKAPSVLRSWKELPEIRTTPAVLGHIVVTEKAGLLTMRSNMGEMTYESFVSADSSFLKCVDGLFTYEWQKAKPWYPYGKAGERLSMADPWGSGDEIQ